MCNQTKPMKPSRKRCNQCGRLRDVEVFYRNRAHSDGRSTYCKECDNARHKTYEQRKKEPHYRWPLVGEAQYKPKHWHGAQYKNLCGECPNKIECVTRANWGLCVLCEAPDTRDASRKPLPLAELWRKE